MNKYAWFFGILLVVIVIVYSFISKGIGGILSVFSFLFKLLGFAVLVAIGVAAIYFLFLYEKKINAILEVFKNIEAESLISCPDNLGDLWLSGDKEHKSVKIGVIGGYSLRQNYKENKGNYENESCFLIKRGFLKSPAIIRCSETLHDELQGDVKIFCNSLVKHALYFYPNVVHLDFEVIDKTIYNEGARYVNLEYISMISPLVKKAIGLNLRDLESLEPKTGLQIIKETAGEAKK